MGENVSSAPYFLVSDRNSSREYRTIAETRQFCIFFLEFIEYFSLRAATFKYFPFLGDLKSSAMLILAFSSIIVRQCVLKLLFFHITIFRVYNF